ncbi:uncharacterized protein EKO05_0010266 [Ascochyta rabiei]|uniref:Zinc ion binding n=1 Tax=Didymella rabiei TaxID=5454 RepID=A0A163F1P7_DIDRA|nr:uncharacterized protein EKO05_0010266 [Ascochyta rabiei]KZM24083.1 zinc ion binding [Ascochyta rabiei]UPX20020.1 hypothetical protein EKO05_0010266 [Ascochyta rabiei]
MNRNYEALREQALSEPPRQLEIRFADDIPVAIPCLQEAMTICIEYFDDPYVFQGLVFFFSALLSPQSSHGPQNEQEVLELWELRLEELSNPNHDAYRDAETCGRVDAVIGQISPWATYKHLQGMVAFFLLGDPQSIDRWVSPSYAIVNRGHDWIVRCALESDIPEHVRGWLQLMYQKQPEKVIDTPSYEDIVGTFTFEQSLWNADLVVGLGGIVPVIKFYLRQAMTIADHWEAWVSADMGFLASQSCMPDYSWCVAIYKAMWQQFKKDLRDPFSEYPYQIRDQLKLLSYMRVFEECWQWVHLEAGGIPADGFDGHNVRLQVHNNVLAKVRDELQSYGTDVTAVLDREFSLKSLLDEQRIIHITHTDSYPYLDDIQTLENGLCKWFYPHLPGMTQEQYDARYPVTEPDDDMDSVSEMNFHYEEFELDDVEVEAYGARLGLADFALDKQPGADDICTICQAVIGLGDSAEQRCVGPFGCLDIFHAECLDDWVNGASKTSNLCPNCQTEITTQQRPHRPKQ